MSGSHSESPIRDEMVRQQLARRHLNIQSCVASVSNRVIARKLERYTKKMDGGGGGEYVVGKFPPPSFLFLALV